MSVDLRSAAWHPNGWVILSAVRFGRDRLVLSGSFRGVVDGVEMILTTATGDHRVASTLWTGGDLSVLVVAHDGITVDTTSSLAQASQPELGCELSMCGDDVGSLLRSGIAGLPATSRAELVEFLVMACAVRRGELEPAIAHHLHLIRQALRPKLTPATIDKDGARGLTVEAIVAVTEETFYVRGWIGHPNAALTSVVAVSPEGARAELLPTLYRFARRDVAAFYGEGDDRTKYGFAAYFTLAAPSANLTGWLLEVVADDGRAMESPAGEVIHGIEAARNLLVGDLQLERPPHDELRRHHLAPAITRVLERAQTRVGVRQLEQYGVAPDDPDVTIIVPLYRRVEFLEHQLIQFAHDPEIARADLLYVLDSPELGDYLIGEAHRLFRLYKVPFRVAVLTDNGGFSTANNIGASLARGRLLLLMNSDVFPDRPGWLSELTVFHDAAPGVGAVGPKLVYEDQSIQHAGMYFDRAIGAREWGNEHYFKGLHRSFAPACVSRSVPAVTAACMMISAELYNQHGGLHGTYVQGDFEDSDLCLRLTEAGYEHWYAADVELYHLEGQSYPTAQRITNAAYNQWRHTNMWGPLIEDLMSRHGGRRSAASTVNAVPPGG
jgi:GT2 family glycosyltransferase